LSNSTTTLADHADCLDASASREVIFTVGHSNISSEAFFRLLGKHGIEILVDTRSAPHSKHAPQFNRDTLELLAVDHEVSYRFHGDTLGGRPNGRSFYDDEGHVLYGRVVRSEPFQITLSQLRPLWQEFRLAFLCSEENPIACHRRLMIGRVLYEAGVHVGHLRGNGIIQTEEQLREAERRSGQSPLFRETEDSWRSVRSVLPTRAPNSSSKR
jgi:uncharacterized protein (DUF488 family)